MYTYLDSYLVYCYLFNKTVCLRTDYIRVESLPIYRHHHRLYSPIFISNEIGIANLVTFNTYIGYDTNTGQ